MEALRILLIGKGMHPHSHSAALLAEWGAICQFVESCEQACALLTQEPFDIILSDPKLLDGPASQMIPPLRGSLTTLFVSCPVDDDCWWMPIVDRGTECRGAPALRSAQFGELLRKLIATPKPVALRPLEGHLPAKLLPNAAPRNRPKRSVFARIA